MRSIYNEIRLVFNSVHTSEGLGLTNIVGRTWVRGHAQDYILDYFRRLSDKRKAAHSAHLDRITAHAFYNFRAPPHPDQIAESHAALKRGIDEDWQASVQRYPEVLEYFYGLVEFTLPTDDEPSVRNLPMGSLDGHRKATRRHSGNAAMAIAFHEHEPLSPQTPPPIERRTPGPRDRRHVRPNLSQPHFYTQYG